MTNYLQIVTTKLIDTGFFDILTFALVTAIFYGLLRKSQIFKSNTINAVISLSIGFFVLIYRVITGTSLLTPLATFFTQWFTIILGLFTGFVVASLFYPNLPKILAERFTRRTALSAMIALGIAILVTSGLMSTFWSGLYGGGGGAPSQPMPNTDVILLSAGLIILLVILIIANAMVTSEG